MQILVLEEIAKKNHAPVMYVMCQLISATALDDINFIMVEVKSKFHPSQCPSYSLLLMVPVRGAQCNRSVLDLNTKKPSHHYGLKNNFSMIDKAVAMAMYVDSRIIQIIAQPERSAKILHAQEH